MRERKSRFDRCRWTAIELLSSHACFSTNSLQNPMPNGWDRCLVGSLADRVVGFFLSGPLLCGHNDLPQAQTYRCALGHHYVGTTYQQSASATIASDRVFLSSVAAASSCVGETGPCIRAEAYKLSIVIIEQVNYPEPAARSQGIWYAML